MDDLTNDDMVVSFEAPKPEHVPGTVPAGLVLTAVRIGQGQVRIEANYVPNVDFDDAYVSLSGYVGAYNPNLFAAAPDLLAALKDLHAHLFGPDPGKTRVEIDDACRAAIAKAEAL